MTDANTPKPASILYDTPAPHVARITLNRADKRNAQDTALLYELNAAFDKASGDNDIKVDRKSVV